MIVQTLGFAKINFKRLKETTKNTCRYIGNQGEYVVANILGHNGIPWDVTEHSHPVDIIVPGYAIEVKTIANENHNSLWFTRRTKKRKMAWAESHGLELMTIVVKVLDPIIKEGMYGYECELLYKSGFKRFKPDQMDSLRGWIDEYKYMSGGLTFTPGND